MSEFVDMHFRVDPSFLAGATPIKTASITLTLDLTSFDAEGEDAALTAVAELVYAIDTIGRTPGRSAKELAELIKRRELDTR